MKNVLEYLVFILFSWFCCLIGLKASRKFAGPIASLFFYIIPIRKSVVIDNLKHAFPEFSEKRINEIAYNSYKSFATALTEILYTPSIKRERIEKEVICVNPEKILEAYEDKKGVILLSAHFGNWEWLAISVASQINKKLNVVIKPQRNPYVTKWMNKIRTKWTNDIVPLGISIRQVYQVLVQKEMVAMVADQRGPRESIKLDFFGRETAVYTGPAVLSLKTGAPLIYGIAVRQDDYSYRVELNEISKDDLPKEYEEKLKVLCERQLKYLEEFIRKHPEQWLWMHKRWKH